MKKAFLAVEEHNLKDLQRLFACSPSFSINEKNSKGETLLHVSCRNGDFEITKFLLHRNADYSLFDNDYNSPLHITRQNNFPTLETLLLKTIDEKFQESAKRTLVHEEDGLREDGNMERSPRFLRETEEESALLKKIVESYKLKTTQLKEEVLQLQIQMVDEKKRWLEAQRERQNERKRAALLEQKLKDERKMRFCLHTEIDKLKRKLIRVSNSIGSTKNIGIVGESLVKIRQLEELVDKMEKEKSEYISRRLFKHVKMEKDFKKQTRKIQRLEQETDTQNEKIIELKVQLKRVKTQNIEFCAKLREAELVETKKKKRLGAKSFESHSLLVVPTDEEIANIRQHQRSKSSFHCRRKSIEIREKEDDCRWVESLEIFIGDEKNNELVVSMYEKLLVLGIAGGYLYCMKKDGNVGFVPRRLVTITNELKEKLRLSGSLHEKISDTAIMEVDVVQLPTFWTRQRNYEKITRKKAIERRRELKKLSKIMKGNSKERRTRMSKRSREGHTPKMGAFRPSSHGIEKDSVPKLELQND